MTAAAISSRRRNLALLAALLGWMFDGMEIGLLSRSWVRTALRELLHVEQRLRAHVSIPKGARRRRQISKSRLTDEECIGRYGSYSASFLVGAADGGRALRLAGDKIGRVRALTVSILAYSLCSGLSAASDSAELLALLRFFGALGMGGEWTLGVALVMELWPDASRGLSSRGGLGPSATSATRSVAALAWL